MSKNNTGAIQFLVISLIWILVTVRESIDHHFAEKQQIIDRDSRAAGKLLYFGIGPQRFEFRIGKLGHGGSVRVGVRAIRD